MCGAPVGWADRVGVQGEERVAVLDMVTFSPCSDPVWLHHHLCGCLPTCTPVGALQQPCGDPPGCHQDGQTTAAPGSSKG